MGMLSKLIKNAVVGTATAGYGLYKAASDAIEEQVDMARIEALEDKESLYDEATKHFSAEDKEKINKMSKAFSMTDIAKNSAKNKNDLASLRHKYGMTKKISN